MKRTHKEKVIKEDIKIVKPIFTWIECYRCKSEFKREKMYKIKCYNKFSYNRKTFRHIYLCTECCTSFDCAFDYREKLLFLFSSW
jgi:hypothetical protein